MYKTDIFVQITNSIKNCCETNAQNVLKDLELNGVNEEDFKLKLNKKLIDYIEKDKSLIFNLEINSIGKRVFLCEKNKPSCFIFKYDKSSDGFKTNRVIKEEYFYDNDFEKYKDRMLEKDGCCYLYENALHQNYNIWLTIKMVKNKIVFEDVYIQGTK